jgi:hypothetical protein
MNGWQRLMHRPFFIRLLHWEYWSFNTIYLPIYPIWLWLCLRARSFFFFAAANPRISNGGFLNESKKEISALIPADLQPRTIFFTVDVQPAEVFDKLAEKGFQFPMIGKPNIGGRGRAIEVLNNQLAIEEYIRKAKVDFHIQEFVSYENEVGIFYFRYPGEANGSISGIVRKEFLSVTGDGKSTVRELLAQSTRAILQLHELEKRNGELLHKILAIGQRQVIVPYGNHARGAKFLDASDLIDELLTTSIDGICKRIPDFYYGRLDIRFRDWAALRRGEDFRIIEVNGAGSEPTHIYDPNHSIFFGWKEIIRHWIILWRISRLNHRLGYPYLTVREGIKMFREDRQNSEKLLSMKS